MQRKQIAIINKGTKPERAGIGKNPTTSLGKRISLYQTIAALKPGEWFEIDDPAWRPRVTAASGYLEIPVRTEKLNNGKLLVERL